MRFMKVDLPVPGPPFRMKTFRASAGAIWSYREKNPPGVLAPAK